MLFVLSYLINIFYQIPPVRHWGMDLNTHSSYVVYSGIFR